MAAPIVLETFERYNVIRFDRPEIRNPLSSEVLDRIEEIFENVQDSADSAVIFTGTYSVFASGADLREIAAVDHNAAETFAMRGQALVNLVAKADATTIAAINGYCFGGALIWRWHVTNALPRPMPFSLIPERGWE